MPTMPLPPAYADSAAQQIVTVILIGSAPNAAGARAALLAQGYTIVEDGPATFADGSADVTRYRLMGEIVLSL
jgi:hypothetical protein